MYIRPSASNLVKVKLPNPCSTEKFKYWPLVAMNGLFRLSRRRLGMRAYNWVYPLAAR